MHEWFTEVIETYINIEKIFFHQNVKGKANSNFIFNIKEYFRISFPKFVLEIENKVVDSYNAKNNIVIKHDSRPNSPRELNDSKSYLLEQKIPSMNIINNQHTASTTISNGSKTNS